jgi:hypothetical protein
MRRCIMFARASPAAPIVPVFLPPPRRDPPGRSQDRALPESLKQSFFVVRLFWHAYLALYSEPG